MDEVEVEGVCHGKPENADIAAEPRRLLRQQADAHELPVPCSQQKGVSVPDGQHDARGLVESGGRHLPRVGVRQGHEIGSRRKAVGRGDDVDVFKSRDVQEGPEMPMKTIAAADAMPGHVDFCADQRQEFGRELRRFHDHEVDESPVVVQRHVDVVGVGVIADGIANASAQTYDSSEVPRCRQVVGVQLGHLAGGAVADELGPVEDGAEGFFDDHQASRDPDAVEEFEGVRIGMRFPGDARFGDEAGVRAVAQRVDPCAEKVGVVAVDLPRQLKGLSDARRIGSGFEQFANRANRLTCPRQRDCRKADQKKRSCRFRHNDDCIKFSASGASTFWWN